MLEVSGFFVVVVVVVRSWMDVVSRRKPNVTIEREQIEETFRIRLIQLVKIVVSEGFSSIECVCEYRTCSYFSTGMFFTAINRCVFFPGKLPALFPTLSEICQTQPTLGGAR